MFQPTTSLSPSAVNLTTTQLLKTSSAVSTTTTTTTSNTTSSQNSTSNGSKLLMLNGQQHTTSPRYGGVSSSTTESIMRMNNTMQSSPPPLPPPSSSFSNMPSMWWNHQQPPPPLQQQQHLENNNLMMMFNFGSGVGRGELNRHSDVAINTTMGGGSNAPSSSWFQQDHETIQQQENHQFYHQPWMVNNPPPPPPSGMWPPGMMMGDFNPMIGYPMVCSVDDIEKSFFNNESTDQSTNNSVENTLPPQQSHFLSQLFPQNTMLNNDINSTTPIHHVNYPSNQLTKTVQPHGMTNPLEEILVNNSKKQEESPTSSSSSSISLMNEIKNLQTQLKAALKVLELEKQKLSSMSSKDTHYIVANQTLEETIRHVKKSLNIIKKKQTEEEKEAKSTSKSKSTSEVPRTLENHYKFRKYSENMYGFFPKHLVNKVRFDSELALSYLTPFNDAFEIASLMNEMIKQKTGFYPNHLIDGTGGLGGNIIGFLRYFWSKRLHRKTVTMIELDERRCNDARYNISLFENEEYKYDKECVTCNVVSGNFIDWWQKERSNLIDKIPETFVFFDPPWGNQDYSLHDFIDDLYMIQENLTPISVKTFSKQLLLEDGVQCVALKVPYNFSESGLPEELEVEYILMKKVKYIMLFRKSKTGY